MFRRLGRARTVLTVIVAVLTVLPATASAAPTWLTPGDLTGATNSIAFTDAGADASGNVVAAWVRSDGTNSIVEVATRPAGGAFTVKQVQTGTSSASDVVVSVNKKGDAIVSWRRNTPTIETWATVRDAGGDFGTAQNIASAPGQSALDPSNAVSENGAMIVVWRYNNGTTDTVYDRFRAAGGGFASAQVVSSTDTWNQSPRAALDDSGKATIVWSFWTGDPGGNDPNANIARVRVRAADGTLGTQRNLSAGAPTGRPMFATVDLDAAGNAVAVWSWWNGTVFEVKGATRTASADTWNNLPKFGESANASFGDEPQVAVDDSGNAVAIWRAADGTMNAASRASGAAFGAAQLGISAPTATAPHIDLDGSGNAIAIWRRSDGSGQRIESAIRPLGGAFGGVKTVSTEFSAQDPGLGVDGLGNAFAVWPAFNAAAPAASRYKTQYAAYDASPPTISSLSVPGTAKTGENTAFGAATFDVWSAVSVGWDFGDGGTGAGALATHAYGSTGVFGVRATATDAVGNAASTTRQIAVSPAVTDADGDGSPSSVDCNDNNPAIHPGAKDVPGNGVDEDCSGKDAIVKLSIGFTNKWTVFTGYTTVFKLEAKRVPKGGKVTVSCKGKGCKFKKKTVTTKKAQTVKLTKYFNVKKKHKKNKVAKLKPKAKVTIIVTKKNTFGSWFVATIQKGRKFPKTKQGCLAVGSSKTHVKCPKG